MILTDRTRGRAGGAAGHAGVIGGAGVEEAEFHQASGDGAGCAAVGGGDLGDGLLRGEGIAELLLFIG